MYHTKDVAVKLFEFHTSIEIGNYFLTLYSFIYELKYFLFPDSNTINSHIRTMIRVKILSLKSVKYRTVQQKQLTTNSKCPLQRVKNVQIYLDSTKFCFMVKFICGTS